MIYSFKGIRPVVDITAFVHPQATVTGTLPAVGGLEMSLSGLGELVLCRLDDAGGRFRHFCFSIGHYALLN